MTTGLKFSDLDVATNINDLLGVAQENSGTAKGQQFLYSNDGTLASNSDAKIPTEKAIKTYADTKAADNTVVHLAGTETITGNKTLSGAVTMDSLNASQLLATDNWKNIANTTSLPNGTTATTQTEGDNSTKVATTAYVDTAISGENFWDRASGTLSPHNIGDNISAGIGGYKDDDVIVAVSLGDSINTSFSTTNKTIIGSVNELKSTKADDNLVVHLAGTEIITGGKTLSGTINMSALTASQIMGLDASKNITTITTLPNGTTATTQSAGDNSTKIATTAYVDGAISGENLWDRTGTTLSPYNAGDDISAGTGGFKDNDVTVAIALGDSSNTSFVTINKTIVGATNELYINKAADNMVVHLAGTETITGNKTLSGTINLSSLIASQLLVMDGSKNITNTTVLPNGTSAITQSAGDNTTKVATTAYVDAVDNTVVHLAGTEIVTGNKTLSGTITMSSLAASQLLATDASKNIVNTTALPDGTTAATQIAGDNSTKVSTTAFVQSAVTAIIPDQASIIYLAKDGNDANNGKSIDRAVQSISEAMSKAAALSPGVNNNVIMQCFDAHYDSNLTLEPYTHFYAPAMELRAANVIKDNCVLICRRLRAGGGGGASIYFATGSNAAPSYIFAKEMYSPGYVWIDTNQGVRYINIDNMDGGSSSANILKVYAGSTAKVTAQRIVGLITVDGAGAIADLTDVADLSQATFSAINGGVIKYPANYFVDSAAGKTTILDATDGGGGVGSLVTAGGGSYAKSLYAGHNFNSAMFYANYLYSINADFGAGDLTGTAVDSAAVSGGYLDLNHNDARYVSYNPVDNVDFTQTGTIRFIYKPGYTGSPSVDQQIFSIVGHVDSNRIRFNHGTDGHLRLTMTDSTGAPLSPFDIGSWSATTAAYEFEIDIDVTNGVRQLFIDGQPYGTTLSGTITRTNNLDFFNIGGGTNSNFYIKDFIVYPTVRHTASYSKGYSLISLNINGASQLEGLYLPANNGGIKTNLNRYERAGNSQEFVNLSFTGPWAGTISIPCIFEQIGHTTNFWISGTTQTGNSTTASISAAAGAVPARFRPIADDYTFKTVVSINAVFYKTMIVIGADGSITISKDDGTQFAPGTDTVIVYGCSHLITNA